VLPHEPQAAAALDAIAGYLVRRITGAGTEE